MTTSMRNYKAVLFASLFMLSIVTVEKAGAQTLTGTNTTSDEQAIRSLVAQFNTGKMMSYTDNRIFVTGAYPKPIIGKEMTAENKVAEERIKTDRQNFHATSNIQRLEVAKAGDMAYEFGTANVGWDTPDKNHVSFESSYLRVWRKVDGEWKVDVYFARPNEEPKIQ